MTLRHRRRTLPPRIEITDLTRRRAASGLFGQLPDADPRPKRPLAECSRNPAHNRSSAAIPADRKSRPSLARLVRQPQARATPDQPFDRTQGPKPATAFANPGRGHGSKIIGGFGLNLRAARSPGLPKGRSVGALLGFGLTVDRCRRSDNGSRNRAEIGQSGQRLSDLRHECTDTPAGRPRERRTDLAGPSTGSANGTSVSPARRAGEVTPQLQDHRWIQGLRERTGRAAWCLLARSPRRRPGSRPPGRHGRSVGRRSAGRRRGRSARRPRAVRHRY